MSKNKILHTRPFLAGFDNFIIKKLKLLPNYYTQNDFLFIKKGLDFTVVYNPRCQLIDFGPAKEEHSYFDKSYTNHECEEMKLKVKNFWNSISLEYFLETGIILDKYISIRLYGVKSDNFPYATIISENNFHEFAEVENWMEASGNKYIKNKYFKYAYWGSLKTENKAPSKKLLDSAPKQKRLNYILKKY